MKKTFTVNGKKVTFTETTAIYEHGGLFETLLLHDEDDEYHDGDCITVDYASFPDTDEEAEDLIANSYWTTYWYKNNDGIIIMEQEYF